MSQKSSPTLAFIQTHTGRMLDLLRPQDWSEHDIDIHDIARGLSHRTPRFSGQTRGYYSAAQHCCMVSDSLLDNGSRLAMAGLLHDGAEAYYVDVPGQLKHTPEMAFYCALEDAAQGRVYRRFGLNEKKHPRVSYWDEVWLAVEARDQMNALANAQHWPCLKHLPQADLLELDAKLAWAPEVAFTEFLDRFFTLRARIAETDRIVARGVMVDNTVWHHRAGLPGGRSLA